MFLSKYLIGVIVFLSFSLQSIRSEEESNSGTKPLDRIKALAGEWSGTSTHGSEPAHPAKVKYRVTAAGSAVIETLFENTPHEMITMYHQDGNDLLLTHYCTVQNQPRMKAVSSNDDKKLEFKFLDGTNMNPTVDKHMHETTIYFVDNDHIRAEWVMYEKGKPAMTAKFDLKRMK